MPGSCPPDADVQPATKPNKKKKRVRFTDMMAAAKTTNTCETVQELPPAVAFKKIDKI